MISIIPVSICFFITIISPQVIGNRLPSSSSLSSSMSSDESLKSLEGQLLGNSLLSPQQQLQLQLEQQPRLSYSNDQAAAVDTLQQEYDEARAYDQLINALQQQLMWGQLQQQQQQQLHDPPIRIVQRSRILYPEDLTSENAMGSMSSRRLNSNRRFPPPPTTGGIHTTSRTANISSNKHNSGISGISSKHRQPESSFWQSTSSGHEQQKRPESPQRLISGSGVSGLANFLTQSYGLGKDGSIGVRFGLS